MLLFNTQQDLENPFDMNGLDDVFFEMDREMDDAWQPLASMAGEVQRAKSVVSSVLRPFRCAKWGAKKFSDQSLYPTDQQQSACSATICMHQQLVGAWRMQCLEHAAWAPHCVLSAAFPCAATPSGYASPRHYGQDTCSSPGLTGRNHPDLSWPQPAPWAQQKLAAAAAGISISRRGSMLGTVTEEDTLIGTQPEAAEAQQPDSSTPISTADKVNPSAASCEQPMPAKGNGAGPSPLSQPLHAKDLHVSLQSHSSHSQSPLGSPRHSGAGTTSTLRPPASSAFAAGFRSLRQRSPSDKPVSPTGPQQQGQQQVRAVSTLEQARSVEMVGQARPLLRCSGDNSQEFLAGVDGRGSPDSLELGGDSSTQLIRDGACRSDDHVD